MNVIKLIRDTLVCLFFFWFIFIVVPEAWGGLMDLVERLQSIERME